MGHAAWKQLTRPAYCCASLPPHDASHSHVPSRIPAAQSFFFAGKLLTGNTKYRLAYLRAAATKSASRSLRTYTSKPAAGSPAKATQQAVKAEEKEEEE
jgi:hypothetical protein